jgi:SAM-dependent methyltransferase
MAGSVRSFKRRVMGGHPAAEPTTDGHPTRDELPAPEQAESDSPVQSLSTLAELDEKLREVDAAWAVSDDKMREVFHSFKMNPPADLPSDPYSPEYAERQFELYRLISGRESYDVGHEQSNFPVDPNRPFPYYTESSETVGHQLMGLGYVIQTMALRSGSSILELGAGWGNTTIALAQMGYDVTAIDIDPTFVGLIKARAEKFSLAVDARCGAFLDIDQLGRSFDAVLFYECFHHCSDHRLMLSKLSDVLQPGGRIFFAAEPIDDSFPVPWGLRLDGESLWAIRSHGWLELGYQQSYFIRMLHHLGWVSRRHASSVSHLAVIFEARKADRFYGISTFDMPPDEDSTWAIPDQTATGHRYSGSCSRLSLERGLDCDEVVIDAVNASPRGVPFSVEHGQNTVTGIAEPHSDLVIRVPYDPAAMQLLIKAETWRPSELLGSADAREIGLGVRSIALVST